MNNNRIKEFSGKLGFLACGILPAEALTEEAEHLSRWLTDGMHGTMTYMERNREKRLDPRLLMEGTRTVIIVLQNYFTREIQTDPSAPIISTYALGQDYHAVMKAKLMGLLGYIQTDIIACNGRAFVDSAPALEKAWARKAGLGWIGKNSLLISPQFGSFFFIGILLTDREIPPDHNWDNRQGVTLPPQEERFRQPVVPERFREHRESTTGLPDRCGTCTRCIDACPTKAIVAPRVVDARRCISYLTIEHKGDIDPEFMEKTGNRVFGCDICQNVCPWNRKSLPHHEPAFNPPAKLLDLTRSEWAEMDEPTFKELFRHSPVKRNGFSRLQRNIRWVLRNSPDPAIPYKP